MFSSMPFKLAFAAVLATFVTGCASGPSLHYRVDFAHRDSTGVPVIVEIAGVPRDSLVLEGYLKSPLMTVRGLEVVNAGGKPPVAALALRTLPDGRGGEADFYVARIEGPLPSRLTLRYRAVLGTREGNEHTGFTGRCAGYADERFAFAGGRSLFLVPSPAGRMRSIDVRFDLPAGWSAVVPWSRDGEAWKVGVRGAAPAEDLLWSALGFGRFDETRVELGGTVFRFEVESHVNAADRDAALRAYAAVTRRVTVAFGRALGKEFTVVIAPPHPTGDEIMPEGWATGTGGTLAPLTTNRAHQLAEAIVDAFLAQDPFKTTVRDAHEQWIVDGVSHLLPWRGLEAAGLSRPEDFDRWIASDYAHELENTDPGDIEWNLEQTATSDHETRLAHEVLAPIAMMRIDEQVRAISGGHDSLETVLRQVFAGRVARSLWASLPQPGNAKWLALRGRYVKGDSGAAGFRDDPLFAQASPTETPQPPRGHELRRLTLALTGNTYGLLENCGCKVNQAGGLARRSTMLNRLRLRNPVFALDAGNMLARPETMAPLDYLSEQEEMAYVRGMVQMKYSIGAMGPAELVRQAGAGLLTAGLPFVIANAHGTAAQGTLPWRMVGAGGVVRAGVVGLIEPGRGPWANDILERTLGASVVFDDPVATMQRLLPEVRATSDLVIAMGQLSPPTIRRMIAACPDLDVIISTDEEASVSLDREGDAEPTTDTQGFFGHTLVLYTTQSSYGLNGAVLGLDAQKRITSAEMFASWLGDSVPDDPAIRAELTKFYDQVGRTQAAQASVPPLFANDATMLAGDFAGVAKCQSCHAQQYTQWHDTPHASAYKTLLDVHRHYQPRCIVCHVVGYGTPKGYQMGSADTHLVGVQCEICHGPGAAHAAKPAKTNIRRAVPEAVCLECHTPDHSDHFVYADKLPLVVHQEIKTIDASGAGRAGSGAGK